ncbi:MAG: sulfur oxidation c-type cytochrome SoxA [Parahaliea sp.]
MAGVFFACLVAGTVTLADGSDSAALSGYHFLGPELRAMQDDAFANPGTLWLQRGAALWREEAGAGGASCHACHGDAGASMAGVAARYPAFDGQLGRVINLEQRIRHCRRQHQRAPAFEWESAELLALSLLVTRQSRGLPLAPLVEGPARASFERGRALFARRLGQLNLSCQHCHQQSVGLRLRGEVVSQGQINGFPIYRLLWDSLASSHRMFAWCNEAVRAQPYAAGAQEYVDLELYLKWRGRGLAVEAPALRR